MHGRLLLAPLVVVALAAGAAAPAAAKTVRVSASDAGDLVTVARGDRIKIVLDANETTGYRWLITDKPAKRVAKVVSSRYVADAADPMVVGSGGRQITVLKAVGRGRTMIGMDYVQVGSGDEGSDFDLFVRVRVG